MTKKMKTALLATLLVIAAPVHAVVTVANLALAVVGSVVTIVTLPLTWPLHEMARTWRAISVNQRKEN